MTEVECIKDEYSTIWYIKGTYIRHREDGPASIWYYQNGNKSFEGWYQNDKTHRLDGPAEIWYYQNGNKKSEYWYQHDRRHRDDGPALIWYKKNGHIKGWKYRINDFDIDKEWARENITNPFAPSPEELTLLRLTWG